MTWKLTDYGKTRVPLMGVEWRDLSDEEFAAAEARHPELRERGYFEQAWEPAADDPDGIGERVATLLSGGTHRGRSLSVITEPVADSDDQLGDAPAEEE